MVSQIVIGRKQINDNKAIFSLLFLKDIQSYTKSIIKIYFALIKFK